MRSDNVDAQRSINMVVYRYSAAGAQLDPVWDLPDDGLTNPYVDLAVGPDGRFYVLDDLADKVLVYAGTGELLREVPVAGDSRSVAGGPDGARDRCSPCASMAASSATTTTAPFPARLDGRARGLFRSHRHRRPRGRWRRQGLRRRRPGVAHLSLRSHRRPCDPARAGRWRLQLPGPQDRGALQIQLGEVVTINLELAGKCGIDEEPTDIVFVVPYLLNLQQGRDRSGAVINSMLGLARRIKFNKHRVGIVSYYQTHKVELQLTSDMAVYTDAVRNITRQDPPTRT
jgi:hypothetical protein